MTLKVKKYPVGILQANCYFVWDEEAREAAVIDPGGEAKKLIAAIRKNALTVRYIIHTHSHWDHTGATNALQKATQAPVLVHPLDKKKPAGPLRRKVLGEPGGAVQEIIDRDELPLGRYMLRVIHTPGHSPGSVCLYLENMLFAGDLLFQGSVGRTDLKGGSFRDLVISLNERLKHLPDRTVVYPGHGPETSLAEERCVNPFFRSARNTLIKGKEE